MNNQAEQLGTTQESGDQIFDNPDINFLFGNHLEGIQITNLIRSILMGFNVTSWTDHFQDLQRQEVADATKGTTPVFMMDGVFPPLVMDQLFSRYWTQIENSAEIQSQFINLFRPEHQTLLRDNLELLRQVLKAVLNVYSGLPFPPDLGQVTNRQTGEVIRGKMILVAADPFPENLAEGLKERLGIGARNLLDEEKQLRTVTTVASAVAVAGTLVAVLAGLKDLRTPEDSPPLIPPRPDRRTFMKILAGAGLGFLATASGLEGVRANQRINLYEQIVTVEGFENQQQLIEKFAQSQSILNFVKSEVFNQFRMAIMYEKADYLSQHQAESGLPPEAMRSIQIGMGGAHLWDLAAINTPEKRRAVIAQGFALLIPVVDEIMEMSHISNPTTAAEARAELLQNLKMQIAQIGITEISDSGDRDRFPLNLADEEYLTDHEPVICPAVRDQLN